MLSENSFKYSEFYEISFGFALMDNCDFAFTKFENSNLTNANLSGSNLCGVKFIDTTLINTNLSSANLLGVDLSKIFISITNGMLPKLDGAYYNSKVASSSNIKLTLLKKEQYKSCFAHKDFFEPTKFPEGFNPKAHGMIDLSE